MSKASVRSLTSSIRLYSGLILMVYVFTHLLNAALGLISIEVMNAALKLVQPIWDPMGFGWLVPGAAFLHMITALYEIMRMPVLRFSIGYWTRLLLGLMIPYVLIAHYMGSHMTPDALGFDPEYAGAIYSMLNPYIFPTMVFLVIVAWGHGCLGMHYWLRFKPWYPAAWKIAIVPTIALPVLAIAGFISGGKEVMIQIQDPQRKEALLTQHGAKTEQEMLEESLKLGNIAGIGYSGFLALAFAGRYLLQIVRKRRRTIRIVYSDGTTVYVPPGITVLNASMLANVRHPSVCGGRGRCSTCRIRIEDGAGSLSEPTDEERKVLTRINAAPNVRLACSASVQANVRVHPLLGVHEASSRTLNRSDEFSFGQDIDIAILFADLRGFTELSEHKLPYDIVFLLNQYFQQMGHAIEKENGHVDKFIGDGIMALFGLRSGVKQGCMAALKAALSMELELEKLNRSLEHDLSEPLRMSIGIHCGHVIAGRMGYGSTVGLTAVGDPVNTASRLEGMTRQLNCNLVISQDVLDNAGLERIALPGHDVAVRGRTGMLRVFSLQSASELEISAMPALDKSWED